MAHSLSITDGTNTVSLSTTGVYLNHYVPKDAAFNEDGSYSTVTDVIEITVSVASTALVQDKKLRIDQILERANRFTASGGKGKRCFVNYSPTGDAGGWRSPLLGGRCELADDSMTAFTSNTMKMRIFITRDYFWEGARQSLDVENGAGTYGSNIPVYSHDDSGHDNWVTLPFVGGTLPAPVEIRMKNTSGGSYNSRNWYIGHNRYSTTAALQIEGETDTGGSNVANAAESNGNYRSYNTASAYISYSIPAATVSAFSGQWAKVMLKMSVLSASAGISNIYVKASLYDYYGLVPLYVGNEVLLVKSEDYFQDLGNIPLPSGNYATDWAGLKLVLEVRTANGVAEIFGIDFVHLMPVSSVDKSYRHIEQRGMVLLNNSEIVDDGIEDALYFYEASLRHPILIGRGNPIMVYPGVSQKIHFLFDGEGSTVGWVYGVTIYYRPRRLSI